MVGKPFHLYAGAFLTGNFVLITLAFLFRKTGGCNNINPAAGNQITRKNLTGHIIQHDFFKKPGLPLRQAPGPEIRVKLCIAGRLMKAAAQCSKYSKLLTPKLSESMCRFAEQPGPDVFFEPGNQKIRTCVGRTFSIPNKDGLRLRCASFD